MVKTKNADVPATNRLHQDFNTACRDAGTVMRSGAVCRNFWGGFKGGYAGTFVRSREGMPELLGAQGGVCRNCCALRGGRPELMGAKGGVCWNFCGLLGRYDGTLEGSEGVCRKFSGFAGGYAGTFLGSGGAMPELLWA